MKFIDKKIRKIYKIAVYLESVCAGVGSLTPVKDAVTKIIKILEELQRKVKP